MLEGKNDGLIVGSADGKKVGRGVGKNEDFVVGSKEGNKDLNEGLDGANEAVGTIVGKKVELLISFNFNNILLRG
jgi:hypothetical protein